MPTSERALLIKDIARNFPWLPINGEIRVADYCLQREAAARKRAIEECAKKAETIYSIKARWGSENSDRYHIQDEAATKIAEAIRRLS